MSLKHVILPFLVAWAAGMLLVPLVRKIALNLGLVDRPGGRKIHKAPIPRVGGVALYLGGLIGALPFLSESPETIGISVDECPALAQTARWLDLYFAGRRPSPDPLPLAPSGTPFRQAVWRILLEIPYGETTSYGAIASRMAREQGVEIISARAVGGAVGHNPISLIIPCHRVIGKHGDLTGFGGGLDRKRWLLIHEGVLAKEK